VSCATPGVAPSLTSPCGPVHVGSFIASNPTAKNFEPHIGVAWDPSGSGKTAVRADYSMFDVLPLPYEFGLNTAATFPYQIVGNDPNSTLGSGTDPNVSFNPNTVRNRYVDQHPKRLSPELECQCPARGGTELDRHRGVRGFSLRSPFRRCRRYQPRSAGHDFRRDSHPVRYLSNRPELGGREWWHYSWQPGGTGIRPVLFDGESTYNGFQAQLKKTMSSGLQGSCRTPMAIAKTRVPRRSPGIRTSIRLPCLFS
jgi:hypothetical protein